MTDGQQRCPLCGASVPRSDRYPHRLCEDCVNLAADEDGRRLVFANESLSGGIVATFAADGAPYGERLTQSGFTIGYRCYVRGVKCIAEEARFGGIVLQPADTD
jgi:hypothetical protein